MLVKNKRSVTWTIGLVCALFMLLFVPQTVSAEETGEDKAMLSDREADELMTSEEAYLKRCTVTSYQTHGSKGRYCKVISSSDINVMSLPCLSSHDSSSRVLDTLAPNARLWVTKGIINPESSDNLWYAISYDSGTACCRGYVQANGTIKTAFVEDCTKYNCHADLTVSASSGDFYIWTLPGSWQSDDLSEHVVAFSQGDKMVATQLLDNKNVIEATASHYWYAVSYTKSGTTYSGYVYAGLVTATPRYDGITVTGVTSYPKGVRTQGEALTLNGTVKSTVLNLSKVGCFVYADNATSGTTETGAWATASGKSFTIKGSAADNGCKIGSLKAGIHTYTIKAQAVNNWATSSSAKSSETKTVLLFKNTFSVDVKSYDLYTYLNYSGKNYLPGTEFTSLNSDDWYSRDTSVTKISVDSQNTHNGYNSLKIVNTAAGSSGKDLAIHTYTQPRAASGYIGDSKSMTLSFWAKASNSGTKMYYRWGYQSDYTSVTFSTSWTKYTIRMDKTTAYNNWMHPYVDRAGTVWITEMQLEDGTSATSFVPETKGLYQTVTEFEGGKYTLPTAPTRAGYTFNGWYTAASGGSQITTSTAVKNGNLNVYAHWSPASYIVYFDANGGSCSTSSKTVTYGSTYGTLPTPTRTGYTFDGWYTSINGGSRVYSSTTVTTAYSHYLYAHWIASGPVITTQPLDKSVKAGETAVFSVSATGIGLTYQWQWRTSSSGTWTNSTSATTGYNTTTLKVSATTNRHGYQYRCKVADSAGNSVISSAVTLSVLGIKKQPVSVNAIAGETATFKVVATGTGKTYQWQYRTSSSGTWRNSTSATTGYNTATLKVSAATGRHGYQYRCRITDAAGNTLNTKVVTLTVLGIKTQPSSVSVAAGKTATFKVVATGTGLTYQWQFRTPSSGSWTNCTSATTGYNTATLKVAAKEFRSGYQYRCQVTDSEGNTVISRAATLTVK